MHSDYEHYSDRSRFGRRRRVIIVDDHAVFRSGLRVCFGKEADLEIGAETGSAAGALELVEGSRPDLVVMDLALPDRGGLELLKEMHLRWPTLAVLVLSMHEETAYAQRALAAGARGYVMKHESPERLLAAVRSVLAGRVHVSEAILGQYLNRVAGPRITEDGSPLDRLSDRELEVFHLVGSGYKNRSIADKLCVSVSTVETYKSHIERKLGLLSADELLRFAIRCAGEAARHAACPPGR